MFGDSFFETTVTSSNLVGTDFFAARRHHEFERRLLACAAANHTLPSCASLALLRRRCTSLCVLPGRETRAVDFTVTSVHLRGAPLSTQAGVGLGVDGRADGAVVLAIADEDGVGGRAEGGLALGAGPTNLRPVILVGAAATRKCRLPAVLHDGWWTAALAATSMELNRGY